MGLEAAVSESAIVYRRWVVRRSASMQVHAEQELVWGQTFYSTCLDKFELHLERKTDVGVLITELPSADMVPASSYSRTGAGRIGDCS